MAKPELGTKRTDPETGKKFYDLGKDPVVSPYTGKSYPLSFFEVVEATRSSARTRERAKPVRAPAEEQEDEVEDEEDTIEVEETEDTVSLNDVEEEGKASKKTAKAKTDSPDVDQTDDEDETDDDTDDDTFLATDEDEDDDVSDIIGGGRDEDDD